MVSAGDNGPVAVAKMVCQAYVDKDRPLMGRSSARTSLPARATIVSTARPTSGGAGPAVEPSLASRWFTVCRMVARCSSPMKVAVVPATGFATRRCSRWRCSSSPCQRQPAGHLECHDAQLHRHGSRLLRLGRGERPLWHAHCRAHRRRAALRRMVPTRRQHRPCDHRSSWFLGSRSSPAALLTPARSFTW